MLENVVSLLISYQVFVFSGLLSDMMTPTAKNINEIHFLKKYQNSFLDFVCCSYLPNTMKTIYFCFLLVITSNAYTIVRIRPMHYPFDTKDYWLYQFSMVEIDSAAEKTTTTTTTPVPPTTTLPPPIDYVYKNDGSNDTSYLAGL